MNIKKLKEIIKDLPDDMLIGSSGHFGEFLECWDISISKVDKSFNSRNKIIILNIDIESAGDEPD